MLAPMPLKALNSSPVSSTLYWLIFLEDILADLAIWAASHGVKVTYEVIKGDFVLKYAPVSRSNGGVHPVVDKNQAFDVVISNPPCFKLNKADLRAQAAAAAVHGQPNIYGLFMAIGAALMRPHGTFIYITQWSFASVQYFRLFREKFFDCIKPECVHVFGSRRDAFSRDAVLQENVIMKGVR